METEPQLLRHNQAPPSGEQKSFDLQDSVKMMRADLERDGFIHPETEQRVYDNECTFVAEGIDRPLYSEFTITRDQEQGLQIFDRGEWKPYLSNLENAREIARKEALDDPRRAFLHGMTEYDLIMAEHMQALQPGESMQWDSPYPKQPHTMYGADFMRSCGFQPDRRMGFLYRAACREDGSITLESHSVDASDDDAFMAVKRLRLHDADADMETMVRTYDGVLKMKYRRNFRAGRDVAEAEIEAFAFVKQQAEYVTHYIDKLKEMAESDTPIDQLEQANKELTYGFWARIKELLHERAAMNTPQELVVQPPRGAAQIDFEIQNAMQRASLRGEVMSGCGGSLKIASLDGSSELDVFDSIFGAKLNDSKESYSFDKEMYCVSCQKPPKEDESKKMCGPCGLCVACDAKFSD